MVQKYGETTTRTALVRLVVRIKGIIHTRTESAVNGILVLTEEDLHKDAVCVACELDDFPFTTDEKCAIINKAWEIIGPE